MLSEFQRVSWILGTEPRSRVVVGDYSELLRQANLGNVQPWSISGASFSCGRIQGTYASLNPSYDRTTGRVGFSAMLWVSNPTRHVELARAATLDLEGAGYRKPGASPELVLNRWFDGLEPGVVDRERRRLDRYVLRI